MKLQITLYLLLLFSCSALFSQETIQIPDVAFEEALIDLKIDTNGLNGNILVSDANYVVNLNIEDPTNNKRFSKVYQKIKDLTGIEHFTNLKRLICFGNEITKLDLSKNEKLTFVNCSQNKITELDISNSPNLFFLSCDSNKLTSLKLGQKPELTEMYANSNNLTKLDLKGASVLATADISSNNINEILVSETVINSIPEGWYKDEKATYVTEFGKVQNKNKDQVNTSTETTTNQTPKTIQTPSTIQTPTTTAETTMTSENTTAPETTVVNKLPEVKTYGEDFKRSVVSEYEKNVLEKAYLQAKKEEIQRKYNIDIEVLSNWIKNYGKLPVKE